jgi:hypothetical protein
LISDNIFPLDPKKYGLPQSINQILSSFFFLVFENLLN